ncbi:MAG: phosphotransferase [Bacteroidales bacterium]|nr:phosphotransferase [Bacteroidales bacterium]
MELADIKKTAYTIFKKEINRLHILPESGSNRKYYRVFFENGETIIAAVNDYLNENKAFVSFARHFHKEGLPVPEILHYDEKSKLYFISDLGDTTLFSYLSSKERNPKQTLAFYKEVVEYLLQFQFCKAPDYSLCFPRSKFDTTSMMWDLNYFKYYFLKLANIPFDEQKIEDDFIKLCKELNNAPSNFFLYRDFQSRNIMIKNENLFFIDFQGGREGQLQYDLASLLYDAKANLSDDFREEILSYYLQKLNERNPELSKNFKSSYYLFALLRIMQAMGAYGYRGFYEKKTHFIQSIPYAAENIKNIIPKNNFKETFPELFKSLNFIAENFTKNKAATSDDGILTVNISSFSFKKGYPLGDAEHGGGFVFDCRSLPNPGREERFKTFNGKDKCIIDWLSEKNEVAEFLETCSKLIFSSIDNYLQRKFNLISVSFGCTGGQHRSVYCTEQTAKKINAKYSKKVKIIIQHREL